MKKIEVVVPHPSSTTYPIFVGYKILAGLSSLLPLKNYTKIMLLIDKALSASLLKPLLAALPAKSPHLELHATEQNKDVASTQAIYQSFMQHGLDRKSLVLNVGGGVLGDMGGFAASTYLRGIDFVQIPTTLLSQVDASVGGKVGVNFGAIKNIIGSFAQPIAVIIDTATLETLPKREYTSGFAEIIKHGAIRDARYFALLEKTEPAALVGDKLIDVIQRSCEIKREVVQADEREGGLRKILNFGHTIGHAVEAASLQAGSPLLHGEAVGIGMVGEAHLSLQHGLLSQTDFKRLEELVQRFGLPTRIPKNLDREDLILKMGHDKKNVGGSLRWSLINGIGEAVFDVASGKELLNKTLDLLYT